MNPRMEFVPRKNRLFRLRLRRFAGNRNVKDRLFCYIFERDRKALLQLYNALNGRYFIALSGGGDENAVD